MKIYTQEKPVKDSPKTVNANGTLRNCVALVAWSPLFKGKLIQTQAQQLLEMALRKK